VPETIVPSGRPVVGGRKQYLADVREYLASGQNAVLRRTISREVQNLVRRLHGKQADRYWELFRSREPGSFDFRARMVRAFVSEHIAYGKLDPSNPWQFPEETLVLRSGLCEDRAFLLAGLMLAAGISSFNVRVALGQIEFTSEGKVTAHDHMWVMYKDETGQWLLLEPLLQTKHGSSPARRPWNRSAEARYRPRFLFNDCHLWQVAADTQPLDALHPLARRWSRLHPRFAGEVHQSILNDALHDFLQQHQRPDILQDLNAHYFSPAFGVGGPTVDQFDRGTYNRFQSAHHLGPLRSARLRPLWQPDRRPGPGRFDSPGPRDHLHHPRQPQEPPLLPFPWRPAAPQRDRRGRVPQENDHGRLQDPEALRPSHLCPPIHLPVQHRPNPHPEGLLRELVCVTFKPW